MAKNFQTLREKMPPEARRRSSRLAAKYRSQMPLDELREARDMTQQHLARILNVNQAAVSKMERRTDMYVSTLQDFVERWEENLKSQRASQKAQLRSDNSRAERSEKAASRIPGPYTFCALRAIRRKPVLVASWLSVASRDRPAAVWPDLRSTSPRARRAWYS